jgi:hypothetical protein
VPVPRVATSALSAFVASAAPGSARARDSVRHPQSRSRSVREPHRACRVSFAVCHRAQAGGAFHLADDRVEGAVRALRRAEIAQARVRFGGKAFQRRSRAAISRYLPRRRAARTRLCPRPAPHKQFRFFFPPDEGGQAGRVRASKRLATELARSAAHARVGPVMPLPWARGLPILWRCRRAPTRE